MYVKNKFKKVFHLKFRPKTAPEVQKIVPPENKKKNKKNET